MIDDAVFHREREALGQRRRDLEDDATTQATHEDSRQERAERVGRLLNIAEGGPFVVEHGTPVQLRSLLQELQLKIELRGRRLDFTAMEPLSQLVRAGSDSSWCSMWSETWNWIMFGDAKDDPSLADAVRHIASWPAVPRDGGHPASAGGVVDALPCSR